MRTLTRTMQVAERHLASWLEPFGLTPSQFDVLATLGDTEGLPFKMISERSMVTGGTLTPVLNRMEAKGLLARCKHPSDNRQIIVRLTQEGQALYELTFLPMVDEVRSRTDVLTAAEQAELQALLEKLRSGFEPTVG